MDKKFDFEQWQIDKVKIDEAYYSAMNINNLALFEIIKEYQSDLEEIYPIIEFIYERIQSMTFLAAQNLLWDAEIVFRPALECFVKLLFITSSNKNESSQLLKEFWNDLSEINSLKQSEQAKKNLKHFSLIEDDKLAFSPLVLPDEVEEKIRERWTKKERSQIQQKWSFSEIIFSLMKNYKEGAFEMFETLLHSYRMSSHVSHGDETGIGIIRERKSRPELENQKAHIGHYLRLMNDSYIYCLWIGRCVAEYLEIKTHPFQKISPIIEEIKDTESKYKGAVFQDADYDKFRAKNK